MKRRKFITTVGAGAASLVAAPAVISSTDTKKFRMVMSWIKGSPGTGAVAERLAKRIELLSGGEIQIRVFGAGEIVGPFGVLDAVGEGTVEFGHTAAFFWQGKAPAAAFYTAVPFGMTATEHMSWIYHGGGGELWDELYQQFGVKPLLASNSSFGMGGWFKKEINSLNDIIGLKYRIPGLGGEVLRRLGAVPLTIAPPEIVNALSTGVVDAAEWIGPWSDMAMGLHKIAPYYYGPGFHEPNGAAEFLVNRKLWDALSEELRQIIETACIAEHAYSLSEVNRANALTINQLIEEHGVMVRRFPADFLEQARQVADSVLDDLQSTDDITARIVSSYRASRDLQIGWSRFGSLAFTQARAG